MPTLHFDGDVRRIYEVPDNASFTLNGAYRVYVPNPIPSSPSIFTAAEVWSRWVDYHNVNKWSTLAFSKTGGAFRFFNEFNDAVFATFDLRLTNGWQFVPADYQDNKMRIVGNFFENADGEDFDTERVESTGVSPRIFFADSLQTIRQEGGGSGTIPNETLQLILDHARASNLQTQKPKQLPLE